MDSFQAFSRGEKARRAGAKMRVFDWNKCAQLIVERGAKSAAAGLSGDWGYTGGSILADGKPVPREDTYTYLASLWATPELQLDDGGKFPCWVWADDADGWDSSTYWPASALAILEKR